MAEFLVLGRAEDATLDLTGEALDSGYCLSLFAVIHCGLLYDGRVQLYGGIIPHTSGEVKGKIKLFYDLPCVQSAGSGNRRFTFEGIPTTTPPP